MFEQLQTEIVSEKIVNIVGFGRCHHLSPRPKLIIENKLLLTQEESELEVDYYIFDFGGKDYFCAKNSFSFHPFENVGILKDETKEFCLLGLHSQYEVMTPSTYESLVKEAKKNNIRKIGICEKNTLGGTFEFQKVCKEYDIDFILGETITVLLDDQEFDCKVFCLSEEGWENLLEINYLINCESVSQNIKWRSLLPLGEGLCLILPPTFPFSDKIFKQANSNFDWVYLDLSLKVFKDPTKDKEFLLALKEALEISKFTPILTHDFSIPTKEQSYLLNKADLIIEKKKDFAVKNKHLINYNDALELVEMTFLDKQKGVQIFERALNVAFNLFNKKSFEISTGVFKLPEYEYSSFVSDQDQKLSKEDFFEILIERGKEKFGLFGQEIEDRIKLELEVIKEGNFIDYFLILWDIVYWCQLQNIYTGNGRGSATGSLVSYLVGITKVNPFDWDLLFERFLNRGRIKTHPPDIDLDLESGRRDDVRNYLENKYGKDYFCSIGTYKQQKIKSGIRDLGRLKGLNKAHMIYLTRCFHLTEGKDGDFMQIFVNGLKNKKIKDFIQENPDLIHDLYYFLNTPKSISIHPCATVIVPKGKPIYRSIPLRKTEDGDLVSEWDGTTLEEVGYLKEDILRLSQLDKIHQIVDLVKQNHNKDIDVWSLEIDDPKVMELFQKGLNGDIFQFGSKGLKEYCKAVKPYTVTELINIVSLFRPGPIQSQAHLQYVELKKGEIIPEYDFGLEEVTKETFGLYIFQEQVMKACQVLGGFDLVETDDIRRALGKKKESVIRPYLQKFLDGAIDKGCDKEEAEAIWAKLERFSGYGFNKSHATAYALIGYYAQWLKKYYPIEFWSVAFEECDDSKIGKEKLVSYIKEMEISSPSIRISPPHINVSKDVFVTDYRINTIYWSLSKISYVGSVALESIIEERAKNGPFYSFLDFLTRVTTKVNKRVITNLVLSGAFDEIEGITDIRERYELIKEIEKKFKTKLKDFEIAEQKKYLQFEYFWMLKQKIVSELANFEYIEIINSFLGKVAVSCFREVKNCTADHVGRTISCAGIITEVVERNSKNGNFGRVTIDQNNYPIVVTIWNKEWVKLQQEIGEEWENKIFAFTGTLREFNGELSIHLNNYSKTILI